MSPIQEYVQPKSLEELTVHLKTMTESSRLLAGGTDLLCQLRERYQTVDLIVSLCQVPELQGIREENGMARIGAMCTYTEIAKDPLVNRYFKALAQSADHVGSKQIRNKGTIGGSLGNASPAGDMMPVITLFHGEIEIVDEEGALRRVPASEFLNERGKPLMKGNEVILAIWLPIRPERSSSFFKLGSRKEVTIAQISLCVSGVRDGEVWHEVECCLGAVDVRPMMIEEANEILGDRIIGKAEKDALSENFSERIERIRLNRKRPPKLKILECERLYKERAVKSVVYDALELLERG